MAILDLHFSVHTETPSVLPTKLDATYRPYMAPINHPLPEYRADVPHLLDPEGIIVNPLFASEPPENWAAIEEVVRRHNTMSPGQRIDMTDVVCEIDRYCPEFSKTQLLPEEQEQLCQAGTELVAQIRHAVERVYSGEIDEYELTNTTNLYNRFIDEGIIERIENEHIQTRIRQARELWGHILTSPWRNYSYRKDMTALEDYDLCVQQSTAEANTMRTLDPRNFSFTTAANNESRSTSGGLCPAQRVIVIDSNRPNPEVATTLNHELVHALQLNERVERLGQDHADAQTSTLLAMKKKEPIWELGREIETCWIDAHIAKAQLEAFPLSINTYTRIYKYNKQEENNLRRMLQLLEQTPKTTDADIPEKFANMLIHSIQRYTNVRVVYASDDGNIYLYD